MDPYIQQWYQSEDAQPYIQQAAKNLGIGGGTSGYEAVGSDPYSAYIKQLINSNTSNPGLQEELLGYYLDYTNPNNEKSQISTENKLNTANTLLSAGEDSPLFGMGIALLSEVYPQLGETGYMAGQNVKSYEDTLRKRALGTLTESEDLSREDYEWQNFLVNQATDEQIREYEKAKSPIPVLGSLAMLWDPEYRRILTQNGGFSGVSNPFDSSFWNGEARGRAALGYGD